MHKKRSRWAPTASAYCGPSSLFLDRAQPPTEEEHLSQYVAITSALGDRPLIIRTLDLGGDKLPSCFPQVHEDNPSLGVRGVRLARSARTSTGTNCVRSCASGRGAATA